MTDARTPQTGDAPAPGRLDGLVTTVLDSLGRERDALEALQGGLDAQLEALRAQDRAALDAATQDVNETSARLERCRQARLRQMRLLTRVLGLDAEATLGDCADALAARPGAAEHGHGLAALRADIRERAGTIQRRCEEIEFALQYAVQLGRDMLQTLQALDAPAPSRGYTATGAATTAPTHRSFLNRVG